MRNAAYLWATETGRSVETTRSREPARQELWKDATNLNTRFRKFASVSKGRLLTRGTPFRTATGQGVPMARRATKGDEKPARGADAHDAPDPGSGWFRAMDSAAVLEACSARWFSTGRPSRNTLPLF